MDRQSHHVQRDIIVIGGSLGAMDALRTILGKLPADLPAAVLIVVHSGPSSPRLMASILQRYTALPVAYAIEGELIEHGRVYLAQPEKHLELVAPGVTHLSDSPKVKHSRPAADRLFESAAEVFGSRVIGIVLSGGDGDGTEGAKAIAAAGGMNMAQDPAQAMVSEMPFHALQCDHPVLCLSAGGIANELRRMLNIADTASTP